MTQDSDPMTAAHALTEQARLLSQSRRELRDHPDQVQSILNNLIETVLHLDDVIEATGAADRAHADTAVRGLGNEAAGTVSAIYAGGLLKAASHEARGLREVLMRAAAETDMVIWPQHDLVAAAELQEYRQSLQQRAERIQPDHGMSSSPAPGRGRGGIDQAQQAPLTIQQWIAHRPSSVRLGWSTSWSC